MFRVLAFTVKPCESPDSRYRILQYRQLAEREDIQIRHLSLIGSTYYDWQIRHVQPIIRALLYPILLVIRFWQVLFLAPHYDAIWISREMAPFGPPILERLLTSRCKRVIFDVDDAVQISDKASTRPLHKLLRDYGKFARMAPFYDSIVCGNHFLADFYRQHGAKNVSIIPTVVDPTYFAKAERTKSDIVRIGWIGTPTNKQHFAAVHLALTQLSREREFELIIVGLNDPLPWDLPCIRYMPWKLEEELSYFSQFDIGIMPLLSSPFAQGKCAFKIIQYMAAGLPVVASPVGANRDVVAHGRNGFLASTDSEWTSLLRILIDDPDLRYRMGQDGRAVVRRFYSVQGVWPQYAAILTGVQQGANVVAV